MELDAKQVLTVLAQKGVKALYHANSVKTSCSFLSAGKLLSRGTVEQYGLAQTPQKSDEIDRKYGVWHDIFLDAVDIHAASKTSNWYGPVLFVLDLELLKSIPTIYVTRCDPLKWSDTDKSGDRFIQTVDELEAMYVPGDYDKMFVIRCVEGSLPLKEVLKEIIVDDPRLKDDKLHRDACDALSSAAIQSSLGDINISARKCGKDCHCNKGYRDNIENTYMMFRV